MDGNFETTYVVGDCCGLMGLLLGHKFQPFYDLKTSIQPVTPELIESLGGYSDEVHDSVSNILEALHSEEEVFAGSVCKRCGIRV